MSHFLVTRMTSTTTREPLAIGTAKTRRRRRRKRRKKKMQENLRFPFLGLRVAPWTAHMDYWVH
jgi:hypothetical protein